MSEELESVVRRIQADNAQARSKWLDITKRVMNNEPVGELLDAAISTLQEEDESTAAERPVRSEVLHE